MNIHSDILEAIHRVLLDGLGSVAVTTQLTIRSKGRPFIMRGPLGGNEISQRSCEIIEKNLD
jgi:hypothetical protein